MTGDKEDRVEVRLDGSGKEVVNRRPLPERPSVVLRCVDGHQWQESLDSLGIPSCPHGEERDDDGNKVPAQVDLVCRACGAGYSVVGFVGVRSCPRCGARMICPRCLASKTEEHAKKVTCPICGKPPAAAEEKKISFTGDVRREIEV